MKAVVQRVLNSSVEVEGNIVGKNKEGYMILFGAESDDTTSDADVLAAKIANLRVFCDENDKMNKSILDINGECLVISQFTLCADLKKGNRPSFINAMSPTEADNLYNYFCEKLKENGVKKVDKGVFGADMKVSLINDGPVTIIYDTKIWRKNGN